MRTELYKTASGAAAEQAAMPGMILAAENIS